MQAFRLPSAEKLMQKSKAVNLLIDLSEKLHESDSQDIDLRYQLAEIFLHESSSDQEEVLLCLWEEFCDLLSLIKTTQDIQLQGNGIGACRNSLRVMAALHKCIASLPSLTTLNLSANELSDNHVVDLCAALLEKKSAQALYLYANDIGDGGATQIAQAIQNGLGFHTLELSCNRIGDPGALALAAALTAAPRKGPFWLYLNHNSIGSDGTLSLTSALPDRTSLFALPETPENVEGAESFSFAIGGVFLEGNKRSGNRAEAPDSQGETFEGFRVDSGSGLEEEEDAASSKVSKIGENLAPKSAKKSENLRQIGVLQGGNVLENVSEVGQSLPEASKDIAENLLVASEDSAWKIPETFEDKTVEIPEASGYMAGELPASGEDLAGKLPLQAEPMLCTNEEPPPVTLPRKQRKRPTPLTPRKLPGSSLEDSTLEGERQVGGRQLEPSNRSSEEAGLEYIWQNGCQLAKAIPEDWVEALSDVTEVPGQLARLDAELDRIWGEGVEVYPRYDRIFQAMRLCPFQEVRVVIIGQDPYPTRGCAHGLAFSNLRWTPASSLSPSLTNIFKEVQSNLSERGTSWKLPPSGDLTLWAKQGVLLLNAALTFPAIPGGTKDAVRQRALREHRSLWHPFSRSVLRKIAGRSDHRIVFVLWGQEAQRLASVAKREMERHSVLTAPHPSPLARGFRGCGHFNAINDILVENGKDPIDWTLL